MSSNKTTGFLVGLLLGLGAPLGGLLLHALLLQKYNWSWVGQEWFNHRFFYGYMAVTTPIVFSAFGCSLGWLRDEILSKNKFLEHMNTILQRRSILDDMTGLYNHRHLLEEIKKEVERAKRYQRPLSGMMIDLDDFKKVNDHYGHLVGDEVLIGVAEVLKGSVRKMDVVGRYGGDEFLIILPEAALETTRHIAERILGNFQAQPIRTSKGPLPITVSIGSFLFKDPQLVDLTSFIEKTDQAMFHAKGAGKNRFTA